MAGSRPRSRIELRGDAVLTVSAVAVVDALACLARLGCLDVEDFFGWDGQLVAVENYQVGEPASAIVLLLSTSQICQASSMVSAPHVATKANCATRRLLSSQATRIPRYRCSWTGAKLGC